MCTDRRAPWRGWVGGFIRRVCFVALAAFVVLIPAPPIGAARPPAPGDAAPPFTLDDLDGREVALSSFRGRPLILHFWATWCPVCREEMPILEQAARDSPDGLTVLGINLGERRAKIAEYAQRAGLSFPLLLDGRGKVAARYGVLSLPITILVGPDGRIAGSLTMGSLTRERLAERLDLLKRGVEPGP